MGLLDQLFGSGGDDPRSQAMGLLAAGMMQGDIGKGLLAANQSFAGEADRKLKRELAQMQIDQNRLTLNKAKREDANEQGLAALMPQFFSPGRAAMGGTSDVNAALPAEFQIGAQSPIPARSPQFDVRGYTAAALNNRLMNPMEAIKLQKAMTPESQINKLDVKDFTPASVAKFNRTNDYGDLVRMDKLHFGDTGGTLAGFNQFTGERVSEAPKTGNPYSDLLLSNGNGGFAPNSPLINAKRSIAAAGAPQVNVNTDKSYFGNVAEGLAKNDVSAIDAARSAPERIQSSQRVQQLLARTPITGTGAEARLSLHRALATAGLADPKNVADTEILASTLASQTLDAIKTSGLGSGQGFTDKDRAFLERAKSGNIEMNANSLRTLAEMNERAARASIKRGNSIISKLRSSPQSGVLGQQLDPIEEPAAYMPPSVVLKPDAAPGAGVRFLGFE